MSLARPSLMLLTMLLVPAAAAVPRAEAPLRPAPVDAAQDASPGTAEADSAELANRVTVLERLVVDQGRQLEEAHLRIERLETLARALAAGSEALATAADQARRDGLEMGVVNPKARTDLLEGLQALTRHVREARLPAAPEPLAGKTP